MLTVLRFDEGIKGWTRHAPHWRAWWVPALYAGAAIAAGLTFPPIEMRLLPGFVSPISVSAATAIYSSIASGMIALTGIVFSLGFVMVQFSATAYSPRLVPWVARDPVISHALGAFTATFLYAIAALTGVDRGGSGTVPILSLWVVVGLLLASVAMFISLVQRISALQVNRVLMFTGSQGRKAITSTYPSVVSSVAASEFVSTATRMRSWSRCRCWTSSGRSDRLMNGS